MRFTLVALYALVASAMFAVMGDVTELAGPRSVAAVSLSGLATLLGLGLAFIGAHASGDRRRRALTQLAAVAWGVSIVVVALGSLAYAGATFVRALGGALFVTAPVLAAWPLGHRLPRYALAAGAALAAVAYVAGAGLVAAGVRPVGLTLPGDLLLLAGYWMTLRTYRE